MASFLVIAAFIAVFLRQAIPSPLLPAGSPLLVALLTLAPMLALALAADLLVAREARRLDRTGHWATIARAERWIAVSRGVGLAFHAFAVLGLGWLDAVRSATGDLVILDELVALLPLLALLCAGWWSFSRIDRRLREATLLRELDEGKPVNPIPSRGRFVLTAARHQIGLTLVPVALIGAWNEAIERHATPLGYPADWPLLPLQLVGIAAVLTLLPPLMSRVWDTIALGPGPLRDRLLAMCRDERVRVRELLVWRTGGTMVNGAVMGLLGPLRYILLTDALLEHLPERQVQAVTAHELGHVRRRHMVWLGVAGIGGVLLASVLADLALLRAFGPTGGPVWTTLAATLAAIAAGLVAFGFASRRFEWQADAFAVRQLSRDHPAEPGAAPRVHPEAVEAMSSALGAVARLNHIPPHRFSWRHGSIARRRHNLLALVGRPLDRLPPDRHAAAVKIAALAALALALGLLALHNEGPLSSPVPTTHTTR